MARPTRSRIIPAKSHGTGKIEKWPIAKLRTPKSNIVPLGSRPRKGVNSNGEERSDSSRFASNDSDDSVAIAGNPSGDDGFNSGYTDEMRAALSQIAEQQQQLATLLSALENPVSALNDTVARELLLLSRDIARSVLQREIEQDPSLLSEFVKSAIAQLPAAIGPPEVIAHPEDLRSLKDLVAPALSNVSIRWTEDPHAERGNFKVKRDDSVINSGIDAMLQRVLSQSDFSS